MITLKSIKTDITIKYKEGITKGRYDKISPAALSVSETEYIKEYILRNYTDKNIIEINLWITFEYYDGIKNPYYVTTEDCVNYYFSFNKGEREWTETYNANEEKVTTFDFADFIDTKNKLANDREKITIIVEQVIKCLLENKYKTVFDGDKIIAVTIALKLKEIPSNMNKIEEILKEKITGIDRCYIERGNDELFFTLYKF